MFIYWHIINSFIIILFSSLKTKLYMYQLCMNTCINIILIVIKLMILDMTLIFLFPSLETKFNSEC